MHANGTPKCYDCLPLKFVLSAHVNAPKQTLVTFQGRKYAFSPHVQAFRLPLKLPILAFLPHVNEHLFVKSVVFHFDVWKLLGLFPEIGVRIGTSYVLVFALSCLELWLFSPR